MIVYRSNQNFQNTEKTCYNYKNCLKKNIKFLWCKILIWILIQFKIFRSRINILEYFSPNNSLSSELNQKDVNTSIFIPNLLRGESRTAAISKMEHFVIIVNGFQPLTIITKRSILDVTAVLDPFLVPYKIHYTRIWNVIRSVYSHIWTVYENRFCFTLES